MKTKIIGNITFVLPFRANHCWVEDSKGRNVAECFNAEIAKELVKILNGEI